MAEVIIKVNQITKFFQVGNQQVQILKGINFEVNRGDFLIIFGPSGCGKSTLLHTILGLEAPTGGTIEFLGEDLYSSKLEDDRSEFRKRHIGMVYQQPNWIKSLSVVENVAFPQLLLGKSKGMAVAEAGRWLAEVGMGEWANHHPSELSSGQQQRVALARALVTDPEVIIADEPTGNLDYEGGQKLMELLVNVCGANKSVLMVTHDLEYMRFAKIAVRMLDGAVVKIYTGDDLQKNLVRELQSKRGVNVKGDGK